MKIAPLPLRRACMYSHGAFTLSCLAILLVLCCGANNHAQTEASSKVDAFLKTLDPFYKQHVVVDGMAIVGSEKVSMVALNEAAYLTRQMLANRPDVMDKLAERTMYVCVMAHSEMQTDLPECRGMGPWWDFRARGLGGRPCSCGEENLLNLKGDPWAGENIFIHELAHGFQGTIASLDKDRNLDKRFRALYDRVKQSGRFRGYAINGGPGEFWAEGVQSWFNCNRAIRPRSGGSQSSFELVDPEGKHIGHLTTRDALRRHMPEYAALLDEAFRRNPWVYVPVAKRLHEPHLRGFDPDKAPEFRWPPGVVEAFYRIEAEKADKKTASTLSKAQKAAARKLGVPVTFENAFGMRFVLIPPGTFMMGSSEQPEDVARQCAVSGAQAGWFHDEHPRHKVTLTKAFYMAVHEVTQGQYKSVLLQKPDKAQEERLFAGYPETFRGDDLPMANISWDEAAIKFCKQLSQKDKRTYTLPTEAQWEYACRAGTGTPFAFGKTITSEQANFHGAYTYGDGSSGKKQFREKPMPAGSFPPNAWGLHDMHGNVNEWCRGWYIPYDGQPRIDPEGPAEPPAGGKFRVLRGGAWRSYGAACRAAFRMKHGGGRSQNFKIGFRVCCAVTVPADADKPAEQGK